MRWNGTKGRRQLFSWRQRRESAEALTSQPRTAGRRAYAEEWRSWMLLGPTQWIVPSQLSFAGCGLPPHSDAYNIACYLTFIFVYLHGAEARRCCFFSFFILWFLSLLCDSFSFYLPPFPLIFCSFSSTVSLLSTLSVSFFSLAHLPPSPLISLTPLALLLSLPQLSSFFSLSLCSFISCAECSPPSTVFLFSIHSISSRFSRQKHFLPNIQSNILSVTPMLNEGVIFYSGFGEPLFFASSVFVCALAYLRSDFSRMGCNQNTITLKSRAQDSIRAEIGNFACPEMKMFGWIDTWSVWIN